MVREGAGIRAGGQQECARAYLGVGDADWSGAEGSIAIESLFVCMVKTYHNDFHKVSPEFWDDLGAMKKLTKLIVPGLPTGFVPYILHNKPFITYLQLGELNNQIIYIICHNLQGTLQSFHFTGGSITYSGLVSILQCMDTLKVGYIT